MIVNKTDNDEYQWEWEDWEKEANVFWLKIILETKFRRPSWISGWFLSEESCSSVGICIFNMQILFLYLEIINKDINRYDMTLMNFIKFWRNKNFD